MEWREVFHSAPPDAFGRFSGPLVVAASGWCLKEDLARAPDCPRMGVNHAGMFVWPMQHWFSCHWEAFPAWREVRRFHVSEAGFRDNADDYTTHSKQGGRADVLWPMKGNLARWGGLSAALCARAMGYAPVYLAGMPMDGKGHFYPSEPSGSYDFTADRALLDSFGSEFVNLHDT